jgi:molybdate transport system permease protein
MEDLSTVFLIIKLAVVSLMVLLLIGTPVAWWLAHTKSIFRPVVSACVALLLVLPPSVLGFYLLVSFGPAGVFGQLTQSLGLGVLPFTFWGLVFGSVVYFLPFVVQPIQNSFKAIGQREMETAATLGASPLDTFFSVVLKLARPGFVTAVVLGFAHTVGEFGVVLMIGGNIPGKTKVMSVAVYDYVEALEYSKAHGLAGLLLGFSFVTLFFLYWRESK